MFLKKINHKTMKLETLQKKSKDEFKEKGFPTKKHENWLYWTPDTDHETLEKSYYEKSDTITESEVVIIKNGSLQSKPSIAGLSITNDITQCSNESLQFNLESSSLSYLNSACSNEVITIRCSAEIKEPLTILITSDHSEESVTVNSKINVIVEENCSLTTSLYHQKQGSDTTLTNTSFELICKDNTNVNVNHIFKDNASKAFFNAIIHMNENSNCNHITYVANALLTRHDTNVTFYKEKATLNLKGVSVLAGEEQFYNHLTINHESKNCFCKQHFKTILDDKAIAEFSGLVYVAKGSHEVDSQQMNQILLFSDASRALSRPQLKIDADDVQCAHGSTIGQLNPEEVHYIKSRGLTESEAKALLTYGFAEEIIEEITDEKLKSELVIDIKDVVSKIKS